MEKDFQFKDLLKLLKSAYDDWIDDDAFGKAAAVAYYAVFALPGLLLVIMTLISLFFDEATTIQQIQITLGQMIGVKSAKSISDILNNIRGVDRSTFTTIIGIGSLMFGATGLFVQLQKSLNEIWEVQKSDDAGFLVLIKDRATSLGIVIVIGFILLVSLILSTAIAILGDWLAANFSDHLLVIAKFANTILSLLITSLLFAAIFKILPDVKIKWRMVWLGAFVTALLFSIGKFLISLYLSKMNPGANFGAGGAIILFLLWISYSCLILFFGAEFTQVFGRKYGYTITPDKHAKRTSDFILREKLQEVKEDWKKRLQEENETE